MTAEEELHRHRGALYPIFHFNMDSTLKKRQAMECLTIVGFNGKKIAEYRKGVDIYLMGNSIENY